MSGFALKIIAIITMFIDHAADQFLTYQSVEWVICRSIGRLAFPIFCFMISEGLGHTKNRNKYLLRLLVFAFISEIPFNLMHGEIWYARGQNVIFTLLIAVACITVYENPSILSRLVRKSEKSEDTYAYVNSDSVVTGFILVMGIVVAELLRTDYGGLGVCVVYAFYFSRNMEKGRRMLVCAAALVGVALLFAYSPPSKFNVDAFLLQAASVGAILPIALYNGKRGVSAKWLFYVFYPAHMLAIYLAGVFLR